VVVLILPNILCAINSLFSWSYNSVLIDQLHRESGKPSFMLLLSNVCRQRFKSAIMKFLGFACLAVLLGVSSTTETQMQINYYYDEKCTRYSGQVNVTWASDTTMETESDPSTQQTNCFNYNYGTSANIADCYGDSCGCDFFLTYNCINKPEPVPVNFANSNNYCLPKSYNYFSFACYFTTAGS
jgi:hypothetical protein